MTRQEKPFRDFDVPVIFMDSPSDLDYVPPKATDPEIIALRKATPGLAVLMDQELGRHIAERLTYAQFKDPEALTYTRNRVATALYISCCYSFDQDIEEVMRHRIKLPYLADDSAGDRWRETPEGLLVKAQEDLGAARASSIHWMNALVARKDKLAVAHARLFARHVGNSALKLTSLGMAEEYGGMDDAATIQKNTRILSMQLAQQASESYEGTGKYPSLAYLATAPIDDAFRGAPEEARAAFVAERDQYPG